LARTADLQRYYHMPRILITIPEKSSQPYRFSLDRRLITLGRASENDIVISCGSVSVHHAELRRVDGGYELRDLGSTNGSKVSGQRYDTIPLQSGMMLHVGDVELEFTLSEEELAELCRETPINVSDERFAQPAKPDAGRQASSDDPVMDSRKSLAAVGSLLVLTVLAFAAFFAGLAVRHHKDTGHSLIEAMSHKNQEVPAEKESGTGPVERGNDAE
jgi:pSer/pThr/pTyr-binding forkhead associated (FHA) protein